jgi:hypothetical protein
MAAFTEVSLEAAIQACHQDSYIIMIVFQKSNITHLLGQILDP